jgi:hypothetical protein
MCWPHLCVQHVQPPVGHCRHCIVALLQAAAGQKLLEHLSLEQLDQLQLTTALQAQAHVKAANIATQL